MKILIANDETIILGPCKTFLKENDRQITTTITTDVVDMFRRMGKNTDLSNQKITLM